MKREHRAALAGLAAFAVLAGAASLNGCGDDSAPPENQSFWVDGNRTNAGCPDSATSMTYVLSRQGRAPYLAVLCANGDIKKVPLP